MKKSGVLLFFLSACLIHLLGQETLRFHPDPILFVQEARDFFGSRRPEDTQVILLQLEAAQKDGLLEENHWIDLARKANSFDRYGAQPYPDFYLLLQTFLEISAHSRGRDIFLQWSGYLDKLLSEYKKNLTQVKAFLEFSLDYSQKGILFKSSAFSWSVKPGFNRCGADSLFYVNIYPSSLVARGSGDSTVIVSASGRYYPETNHFYGDGGVVTWESLGIPANQVSVKLNRYKLDLSKSVYTVDSVNLIDKRYFTEPIMGRIENKIVPGVSPEMAGYPRFTSYELRNRIKNIYPGMDYEGGFSLQGLKVLGTGLPDKKSVLIVFYKEKPLLRLASNYFSFQPAQARGINTEASIYLEADSIHHPGLLFQYSGKQKEILLIRDGQGLSPSRFLNTYHDYDLNVELIRWRLGDNFMTMSGLPGNPENRASFESADFFNIDRYNEILVADTKHPVAAVKQCADYYYSRSYTLTDLSKFMKKPNDRVEEMLLRLSFLGFVKYNSETQKVEVMERAYDFLKKNAGLQDYDVIRFESVHQAPEVNATLDLTNNHLKVSWVNSVEISQTRQVSIFPTNQTIEILKGRDILFNGEVQGGLVRFYGTDFRFVYDDFSIRFGKLDRIKMKVYEKPAKKNAVPLLADVTSVIENTRGVLHIDEPTNKSGLKMKDYPEYPILQTDTNAFVYYDQQIILNGIYPRKTFNFNISPFTLRGLNLYTFSDSLIFPGLFITADIFPPLELALRHQTDHSLGFATLLTPEEGYPVYKDKGRFYNSLAMSKAGLKGSGKLEYLNSTVVSTDFLFLPEQVSMVADLAVSRDTVEAGNPATNGQKMSVKWYPGGDKLVAQGTKEPLNMYGTGKFDGVLSVEPQGLTGKGTMHFKDYSLTSNEFKFFQDSYEASKGILKIFRDSASGKPDPEIQNADGDLLVAQQFNGLVDVKNQKARFDPVPDGSKVVFTQNRFEGITKGFNWDMANQKLSFEEVRFKMAVKPSDSLNFTSGLADFDLKDLTIRAHSVTSVDVADVRVFPFDRNLVLRKNAVIDSLTQATIVSKDTSLVHKIINATVTISDDKKYNASGSYQYKDIAGREFPITFSDIQPDKAGISTGKGQITPEGNFNLSPAFKYYGLVEWNNNERFLLFDGQTQLSHTCPNITLQWIRFTSRIFPDSVSIPIDSLTTNDQNERLFKGFFLSNQPVELYSTFVGPHTRYSDQLLISASGQLWYDEKKERYLLASPAKKADPEADGPILTLDAKSCITVANGPLTLGVDLGQVKLNGAGTLVHDLVKDTIQGSVIMMVDFFFDPKLLEFMAKSINNASGLEPVNYSNPEFRDAFKDLLGRTKGEELLEQISLTGKWRKIPDELLHTLVFTDVHFNWNPETGSYQSTGKLGIGNIMEEAVNRKVNGYIEVVHRRGGDALTMYIELDRQNYFFLSYTRGVMSCVAGPGLEKFNTMIRGTKEGKLKQQSGPGETEYQYYMGTYQQVSEFLRRFNVER
ncbi:MAG: hypothetical protein WC699_00395 [Bacteroidales bacterium]|jgi:hypothetical protein